MIPKFLFIEKIGNLTSDGTKKKLLGTFLRNLTLEVEASKEGYYSASLKFSLKQNSSLIMMALSPKLKVGICVSSEY